MFRFLLMQPSGVADVTIGNASLKITLDQTAEAGLPVGVFLNVFENATGKTVLSLDVQNRSRGVVLYTTELGAQFGKTNGDKFSISCKNI
jgi:hypothetical protein